ncbi:amidase [Nocardia abscessus]|uniref:amidase n=1 Tax=Nocardia abscessus TaxID=120957 RepID=UPI002453C9E5|nr:amidase [Nocardia abscessus]
MIDTNPNKTKARQLGEFMNISESDLPFLSATEALAAFRSKELSPVELVDALFAQIDAVNSDLNCFTYTYFDRAREQARKAEQIYASSPNSARPLEGIPCAIKDWHAVEGEITTYGSRLFKDFRPDHTAPTVQRLLDAGIIMHARTTTPEFAHSGHTQSPLWGVTRNPWNLDYGPGGSSGGAGAALASGMTTIADGTDGGGSLRSPASVNGVVGYKPPFGRNPLDPEHPNESLLTYGPLTRTVADAALMQNVMSGVHPGDSTTLRDRVTLPTDFESVAGLRVALSMDLGYCEVSDVVRANTMAAARTFEQLGCTVEEVDLGWDLSVLEAWLTAWESTVWSLTKHLYTPWRAQLDPFLLGQMEAGSRRTVPEYYAVNSVRQKMFQKLGQVLESHDVLICPTLGIPAVKADHRNDDGTFEINGKPTHPYIGWMLTYPFNLVNQCPVASVPSGFDAETGIPTGLQIVGKTFDDERVFRFASALEQASSWHQRRPALATPNRS